MSLSPFDFPFMVLLKVFLAEAKATTAEQATKSGLASFLQQMELVLPLAGFLSAVVGVFGNTAPLTTFHGNVCLRGRFL